jgi:hypothetical protein
MMMVQMIDMAFSPVPYTSLPGLDPAIHSTALTAETRERKSGSMTVSTPYPRDMVGYGAEPPDARWPGGARIAVQVVVNYEEGGENNILHGDPASEAFLSESVGAVPWPGQRNPNMESVYEYGSRAGFWRLHRLLTEPHHPGDRLRRRHRPHAQPARRRGHARGRLGDRQPRPQMDRLQGFFPRRRAAPPRRRHPASTRK